MNNAVATLNQAERSVKITCQIGHRFPDGERIHVYQCKDDGDWEHIPKCDGSHRVTRYVDKFANYHHHHQHHHHHRHRTFIVSLLGRVRVGRKEQEVELPNITRRLGVGH